MVHWLMLILTYDLAILKLSLSEVTLSLRLLHYKNRNGLTYENRPCDARLEHDINRDGRCDTGFLFCLVKLPFQNPHNCTLGDHFTGFVGADDIHFININEQQRSTNRKLSRQRSSMVSLWFQPTIYFRFKYPKTGIGLIVEVFDIDDLHNQTIHDSIDFYGRTLLDLKLYPSVQTAQPQRIYLKSLFGSYTNLTADFSLYCSPNYFGSDCETVCLPNQQRYDCEPNTGQKLCKHGYFGQDCLNDVRACEDRPCQNNGTCVVYLRSYLCQCQKGFTGRSCEFGPKIDNSTSTCHRAICVHGDCSIKKKCICHEGWTSDNCNQTLITQPFGCDKRPCLHNSTCEILVGVNPESAYRCHCRSGFTGRNCEVAIVTSCERTPCVHGRCIKIDLYTEICLCERQWTGIDCSRALTISSSTPVTIALLPSTTTTTTTTTTTRKSSPSTTLTSAKPISTMATTTFKTKLAKKPLAAGLRDYLDWLNANYGLGDSSNFNKPITKSPDIHKFKSTPCLSAPCLHNSTCIIQSDHAFQCICPRSFIGVYCEIEQNLCDKSPCLHQSVCVTKSNHDIQCICRPHYTGKFCEHPPPFQPPPSNPKCNRICRNGGICLIDEANQEQCICKSTYTGIYCELLKNNCSNSNSVTNKSVCLIDPCLSHPCQSNGTCHSLSSNLTCSCVPEFTGSRCEIEIDSEASLGLSHDGALSHDETIPSNNTTDLWPLAIVFGYVFSLMLVFIIIWFLWYGLTIRPQSYFRSDIPFGERVTDRYQPYRLGVSNPLFFTNQEFNGTSHSKSISTPPTTISHLDEWTRTLR